MTLGCPDRTLRRAFFCTGFSTGFPNVTRLTLSFVGRYYVEPGVPLLDMISLFPALQELYISTFGGIVSDPSPQAVPPPGLRRLELAGDAFGLILKWMMLLMTNLSPPTLESLTMDLTLLLYRNMDWAALDTALQRFPRLQNVLVKCGRHHGQRLYEALPLLATSGMLSIK
ncbi:hypothetical protein MSAN_00198200 [Mycena sanguinolenta]|uniref:Uncharacterized protein n=1 Tax=Mycena sanguinolenta TaxID=230812 RepID=A0A8H6ZI11_9AGAR|nr:hypothetical protein MSAN_00198200 [Mycena sanguinolenta]